MKNRKATLLIVVISIFLVTGGGLILAQRSSEPEDTSPTQAPELDYHFAMESTQPTTNDAYINDTVTNDSYPQCYGLYEYHIGSDNDYEPQFVPVFTSEPLPEHIIEFITGVTFREYTPFPHSFLSYLTITHVDFNGDDRIGHMIVAEEIADEVLDIFREIYVSGFPIYSIRLIDYFYADDYLSLAANNSSAFNFRYIANTNVISRHGFGMAIDINPIQNPYVRGDNVLPEAGRAYLDRNDVRPGMIVRGDVVYQAFTIRGWTWGGNWTSPIDYHHFERR